MLKPVGVYIAISYGHPDKRRYHLKREHLDFEVTQHKIFIESLEVKTEIEEKAHYVYICHKGKSAAKSTLKWPKVEEYLLGIIKDKQKKKWWKSLFCIKE